MQGKRMFNVHGTAQDIGPSGNVSVKEVLYNLKHQSGTQTHKKRSEAPNNAKNTFIISIH